MLRTLNARAARRRGSGLRVLVHQHLAHELGKRQLAFIFARESRSAPFIAPQIKRAFGGVTIANQEFTREEAENLLQTGDVDAISWGQLFIANPDLPLRLERDAPLNEPNPATYYQYENDKSEGYTDYPALEISVV